MITNGFLLKLIILDSSLVTDVFSPGNPIGLIPCSTNFFASSEKQSSTLLWKIFVASTASGLSI